MKLTYQVERWPLRSPFRIAGRSWTDVPVLFVELRDGSHVGRAETYGIDYRGETPETMAAEIDAIRELIEAGIERQQLLEILPVGGARNGIDCALWDLEAKRSDRPVWELSGIGPPKPLLTAFTIGAAAPEVMATHATKATGARALKLKLTGEEIDGERVRAVRGARPDVRLCVDGNCGFTPDLLDRLTPVLADARVELVEQPLPPDEDGALRGWQVPFRLVADESFHDMDDLPNLLGRYKVANIKLDKCGGLTRALEIVAEAERLGLEVMVGNMLGTSLAMAPAFLAGQRATIVDLDGPSLLSKDRSPGVSYRRGKIDCPDALWGSARNYSSSDEISANPLSIVPITANRVNDSAYADESGR